MTAQEKNDAIAKLKTDIVSHKEAIVLLKKHIEQIRAQPTTEPEAVSEITDTNEAA